MPHAVAIGLGTWALWILWVTLLFTGIAVSLGRLLAWLVPAKQQRLPRSFILTESLAVGVVLGVVRGVHVGALHGLLAAGDALAGAESRAVEPARTLASRVVALDSAITVETHRFAAGAGRYIALSVVLGDWAEPVAVGVTVLGSVAPSSAAASAPSTLPAPVVIWQDARPALERLALRSAAVTILAGVLALLGHALVVAVVLMLGQGELRRADATRNWNSAAHAEARRAALRARERARWRAERARRQATSALPSDVAAADEPDPRTPG